MKIKEKKKKELTVCIQSSCLYFGNPLYTVLSDDFHPASFGDSTAASVQVVVHSKLYTETDILRHFSEVVLDSQNFKQPGEKKKFWVSVLLFGA